MSLTQKHYTSFLATINEKKDELETLIDRLQLDTCHRTYMTTETQVIITGKQTISHLKMIKVIISPLVIDLTTPIHPVVLTSM